MEAGHAKEEKEEEKKKCYQLGTSSIITAIADSPLHCGLFHLRRLDFDGPAKVHGLTSRHPRLDSYGRHDVHDSVVTASTTVATSTRPPHRLRLQLLRRCRHRPRLGVRIADNCDCHRPVMHKFFLAAVDINNTPFRLNRQRSVNDTLFRLNRRIAVYASSTAKSFSYLIYLINKAI